MVYPETISNILADLRHFGSGDGEFVGKEGNFHCGSFIRFKLEIDPAMGAIVNANYTSNGCGYMIASAEVLAEHLRGRELADLHGLNSASLDKIVGNETGYFPDDRQECSTVVFAAVRSAFADLRTYRIEEFRGERALICTCFGVTEDRIVSEIESAGLDDVEGVTRACNAGGGCGSCHMLIRELIDAHSAAVI